MFRGSVKGTGYPLHSPISPSIPTTFQLEPNNAALNTHILLQSWFQTSVLGKRNKEFSLTPFLPSAAGAGVATGGVDVEASTSNP